MTVKYRYKVYQSGEFITLYSPVEIIRNDEKTYLVKTLDFCRGYAPGKVLRVHKKNIRF